MSAEYIRQPTIILILCMPDKSSDIMSTAVITDALRFLNSKYIHTHIHAYIHTYTHSYIHKYLHTCVLVLRARLAIMQRRAFSVVGPSAWTHNPLSCIPC